MRNGDGRRVSSSSWGSSKEDSHLLKGPQIILNFSYALVKLILAQEALQSFVSLPFSNLSKQFVSFPVNVRLWWNSKLSKVDTPYIIMEDPTCFFLKNYSKIVISSVTWLLTFPKLPHNLPIWLKTHILPNSKIPNLSVSDACLRLARVNGTLISTSVAPEPQIRPELPAQH